jgi:hypothetical protein
MTHALHPSPPSIGGLGGPVQHILGFSKTFYTVADHLKGVSNSEKIAEATATRLRKDLTRR